MKIFEKNNELVRTKTNSGGVSSYRVRCVRCYFFHTRAQRKAVNLCALCVLCGKFSLLEVLSNQNHDKEILSLIKRGIAL